MVEFIVTNSRPTCAYLARCIRAVQLAVAESSGALDPALACEDVGIPDDIRGVVLLMIYAHQFDVDGFVSSELGE